jgi:hypothetical protein
MAVTVFLKLTDYVDGAELCELSPETLQTIVCGGDGVRLERIRQSSGAKEIRFISAPFPGFYVKSSDESGSAWAVSQIEAVMVEIKKAAISHTRVKRVTKKQNQQSQSSTSRPSSFKNAFYHPLYSASQYHLMPGLLPTPTMSTSCSSEQPSSPQPMSDEDCERILSSPYLCAWKKRSSPQSDEGSSAGTTEETKASSSSFDKELEGCLPGVPGVRQSKEYKRIRRKISEIDELVKSGVTLDSCQKTKVGKRPEYVAQLRHMLLNGLQETREEEPTQEADESRSMNECPCTEVQDSNVNIECPFTTGQLALADGMAPTTPVIQSTQVKQIIKRKNTRNKVIPKKEDFMVRPSKELTVTVAPSRSNRDLEMYKMIRDFFTTFKTSLVVWIEAWSDFFIGIDPPPLRSSNINVVVNSHQTK